MKLFLQPYDAPCGKLLLGATDKALMLADWIISPPDGSGGAPISTHTLPMLLRITGGEPVALSSPIIRRTIRELDEYFSGQRRVFSVPLAFAGTPFQQAVWNELLRIPYGTTVSYRQVADRIGKARGVRGVAQAIGANRMSVLVPCHRVIGSDGSLTGYAGGLDAKQYLLRLENIIL